MEDNVLYVIAISGGQNIDADDDGVIDSSPTSNLGTLHLVALSNRIKTGGIKANILTDIVYHKILYLLLAKYPQETIQRAMNQYPPTLLKEDIDGDNDQDHDDLLLWDPVPDKDKAAIEWSFYQSCIRAIHSNGFYNRSLPWIFKTNVIGSLDIIVVHKA